MIIGEVRNIRYEAGEFALTQGHKGYERSYRSSSGRYVSQRGYGWATECKGSKLILEVQVGEDIHDVWIDRFFKDNLGRLTEKRRMAIRYTTPAQVPLEENYTRTGSVYYKVPDEFMNAWLHEVYRYI